MRFLLASAALLAITTGVLAATVNDDTYSSRIDIPVSANVSDGSNAIARFLGFKCPKGHRCLPVLECLPCDYGTYKADEGSDLCERCPGGCTTLRKGAESKKECVPKCPPGYEESECGKTCTKCRAGFYKSSWKNKPCSSCPSTSSWDPNLVGMTKRMQCDAEDPVPTTPPPGGDLCTQKYGTCTQNDYENTRLRLLEGSRCKQFCHCAHNSTSAYSTVDYYWEEQTCAAGTLFDETLQTPVCNHENQVNCSDTGCPPFDADIIFALDNSGSLSEDDFNTLLDGVNTFIHSFVISATGPSARFGVVTFGNVQETIFLNTYTDKEKLKQAIAQLKYGGGFPDIGKAITLAKKLMNTTYGNRKNVPDIGIAITASDLPKGSGGSSASVLKSLLSKVFAVGIGLFNSSDLYSIASQDNYVVETSDVTELINRLPELTSNACALFKDPAPTTSTVSTAMTIATTSSIPAADRCKIKYGICNRFDYEVTRLIALPGTNCDQFCQCAHAQTLLNGSVTYYWEEHKCAAGTLFDETLPAPGCNHYYAVKCGNGSSTISPGNGSTTISPVSTSNPVSTATTSSPSGCVPNSKCDKNDYEVKRLMPLYGSNCSQFCQCAYNPWSSGNDPDYYWQEMTCSAGTLFDTSLIVSLCNHAYLVICRDPSFTTPTPTTSGPLVTGNVSSTPDGCPTSNCSRVQFIAMPVTNCSNYCQCNTATGKWVYYLTCPLGTRFNNLLQICDWPDSVDKTTCSPPIVNDPIVLTTQSSTTSKPANATSAPTNTTLPPTTTSKPTPSNYSLYNCTPGAVCYPHERNMSRTIPWPGTSCRGYCECNGSVWVGRWCDPDQAYDQKLYIPSCNWNDSVKCNEDAKTPTVSPPTTVTVTPVLSVPEYGSCTPGVVCMSYEYTTKRVLSYFGTNCTQYCQCVETVQQSGIKAYMWQLERCPTQTILDQHLPTPNCNWGNATTCAECPDATADIVFVFDSSGSVGSTNFAKMLEFANQIIQVFDVSPDNDSTRFAAVTYGDYVYQYFKLSAYTNKVALQDKVKKLTYFAGYTYTDQALSFVQSSILKSSDNRPYATDIVIVITDGKSTVPSLTKIYADRLKQTGVKVLAVGIVNADQAELEYIASSKQNVYTIDNFDALRRLKNELRQETCGGSGSQTVSTSTTLPSQTTTASTQLTATTTKTSSLSTTGTVTTSQSVTKDGCPASSCSSNYRISMSGTGCTKYCQCDATSSTWVPRLSCGSGLLFNNLLQACDWAHSVDNTTCLPPFN